MIIFPIRVETETERCDNIKCYYWLDIIYKYLYLHYINTMHMYTI